MGSVIFVVIGSVLSVNNKNWTNDVRKNVTVNELNGIRFQRILQRKKRFLIFPPGSAIVVCELNNNFFLIILFQS